MPVALGIALFAPLVLIPFGHEYVTHGTPVLRILAVTSCLRSILFLYGTMARLAGKGRQLLVLQGAVGVVLLPLTLVLTRADGLVGAAWAWFGTHFLIAAVVLPLMVREFVKLNPKPPVARRPERRARHGKK
jgi:O-antigen/teichoic acid export membrane protein